MRGPEEDGVHNQERPQLLDSAENAGYDESKVWEGHRELDQDGNPVYAVTRREANIQAEDLRALQRKQRELSLIHIFFPNFTRDAMMALKGLV